jgi:ATP phosphoribosyltransferase regulatory subunit
VREALLAVPDLYGQLGVLDEARRVTPWDATLRELDRLEAIVSEFEDASELLLDLGMARRLAYYTGVTFRAYTFDFGQPLLGGGRYDGALLPAAAGFTIGIERLAAALPAPTPAPSPPVLALDDAGARRLRAAGVAVVRSLSSDLETARDEAREQGARYLLGERLEPLVADATDDGSDEGALRRLLEGDRGE